MPPQNRPQADGGDPALALAQLKASRDRLAAQIVTDKQLEAMIASSGDLERANNEAKKQNLEKLDARIAELEKS